MGGGRGRSLLGRDGGWAGSVGTADANRGQEGPLLVQMKIPPGRIGSPGHVLVRGTVQVRSPRKAWRAAVRADEQEGKSGRPLRRKGANEGAPRRQAQEPEAFERPVWLGRITPSLTLLAAPPPVGRPTESHVAWPGPPAALGPPSAAAGGGRSGWWPVLGDGAWNIFGLNGRKSRHFLAASRTPKGIFKRLKDKLPRTSSLGGKDN